MDIQFWLRKHANRKTGTVYCHIVIDGTRTKSPFSTQLKVEAKNWDSSTGMAKRTSTATCMLLDALRTELTELFLTLKTQEKNLTAEELKNAYLKHEDPAPHFLPFAQTVAEERGEKERTPKTYLGYLKNIRMFCVEKKFEKKNLTEIEVPFISKFQEWMVTQGCFSHNYTAKHLQFIKLVMKQAHLKGHIKNNPLHYFPVKIQKPKEPVFLTEAELQLLSGFPFIEGLQKVADCFLFQCYTGFSYDCLKSFSASENLHILPDGRKWIKKERGKTGELAVLPLLADAQRILDKYPNGLPVYANQVMNRYLLQITDMLGIKKHVTTHTGRKTFATRMLNKGVSIETVSKMLGHANTTITQSTYAKVQIERISKEVWDVLGMVG